MKCVVTCTLLEWVNVTVVCFEYSESEIESLLYFHGCGCTNPPSNIVHALWPVGSGLMQQTWTCYRAHHFQKQLSTDVPESTCGSAAHLSTILYVVFAAYVAHNQLLIQHILFCQFYQRTYFQPTSDSWSSFYNGLRLTKELLSESFKRNVLKRH